MAGRTWKQGCGPGRLLIGVALALVLSGCGSDDASDDTATTPSATPTETPSETPSETLESPEATPTETDSPTPGASPLEVSVVTGGRGLSAVVASTAGDGTEEVAGKVIVAQRGCLHLTNRSGPPTLLVLPPGAEIDTARRPTLLLDGARYPVGTPVRLTGAALTLDAEQAAAISPCVARGPVFQVASVS